MVTSQEDTTDLKEIWDLLENVSDPEIPVLSVVDLGIVRKIEWNDQQLEVTITPTYSGCPAMDVISVDIEKALQEAGYDNLTIKTTLSPAWTTDWLTDSGREKLEKYGIAPPAFKSADKAALLGEEKHVRCPHCGSNHTQMISAFGSTACKALYKCLDCAEPFDYFKCL